MNNNRKIKDIQKKVFDYIFYYYAENFYDSLTQKQQKKLKLIESSKTSKYPFRVAINRLSKMMNEIFPMDNENLFSEKELQKIEESQEWQELKNRYKELFPILEIKTDEEEIQELEILIKNQQLELKDIKDVVLYLKDVIFRMEDREKEE